MQLSSCRTQAANHSGSMCSYQQVGGRPGVLSYPTRPANPAASAAVRSRRGGLTCLARRTKSGGGERDTKQATNATSNSTASSRSTTPPPSKNSQDNRSNTPSRNSKQQVSQLEAFIRDTPVLNRFLDGTLILGDAVMLVATEASSERLPVEQIPALAAVAVGSWVIAGAILGDYTMEPDPDENPLSNALGWPIFQAVVDAMITWAVSMVVSIIGFSWLVSNFIVDAEAVLELTRDGMLSPQLEISVAMLITMACWRGMAARLRL